MTHHIKNGSLRRKETRNNGSEITGIQVTALFYWPEKFQLENKSDQREN